MALITPKSRVQLGGGERAVIEPEPPDAAGETVVGRPVAHPDLKFGRDRYKIANQAPKTHA